jgi:hypothetical protein
MREILIEIKFEVFFLIDFRGTDLSPQFIFIEVFVIFKLILIDD